MAALAINPTIPVLPVVLNITDDEMFCDDEKFHAWYTSLMTRRLYISTLVESCTALYLVNPAAPAADYFIVSPSVKGLGFKYQLTKFDELGAVYDCQRDTGLEIAEEIPNKYILIDLIK